MSREERQLPLLLPILLRCDACRLRGWSGNRRLATFDHRQFGDADAEGAADFGFNLAGEVGVLFDERLGVLAALAEARVAVGEPGAGLVDDLVLDPDVD